MRRSVPVFTATAGTLALLASFHTSPGATGVVARAQPAQTTQSGGPADTANSPTAGAASPAGSQTASTTPPSTSSPTTAGTTRTIDGPVVPNGYGDVQVRVTLRGRQIVDVQALTLPRDRSRSAQISSYAAPRLRAEVLQAQSAQIDSVSGASYTSESYAESLQGALDHAS